jgi:hypothetical protein
MGLLFVICARFAFRCLEIIPVHVLPSQAAVGENALPNLPRPNFRKGWHDWNPREYRGRVGRGVLCERHGSDKEIGGKYRLGGRGKIKRVWDVVPCRSALCFWKNGSLITAAGHLASRQREGSWVPIQKRPIPSNCDSVK